MSSTTRHSSRARQPRGRTGRERSLPPASHPRAPVAAEQSLGTALDFMRTLWYVDQGLHAVSGSMRQSLGVTGPQRLVLRIVGRHSGISPGELADVLRLHPSTVTGIVKRLVARDYLLRGSDARDGRRAVLTLTAKGRAIGNKPGPIELKIEKVLRVLGEREVGSAEAVLRAIARALTAS